MVYSKSSKKVTVATLAKKVKTLAIRDKPEMKLYQPGSSNNTVTTVGRVDDVIVTAAGSGSGQRQGLKIRIHDININFSGLYSFGAQQGTMKFYLIQDTQCVQGVAPSYADVFNSADNLLDFKNESTQGRFKILKTVTLTSNSNSYSKLVYTRMRWHSKAGIVQEYATNGNIAKNPFYLVSISDILINPPTKYHKQQVKYSDV